MNIAQGTANAGKVLGINDLGNVEPTEVSGGEVWEEVNLNNWPSDWSVGDRIKITFNVISISTDPYFRVGTSSSCVIIEVIINSLDAGYNTPVFQPITLTNEGTGFFGVFIQTLYSQNFNNLTESSNFMIMRGIYKESSKGVLLTWADSKQYINKIWRLKK